MYIYTYVHIYVDSPNCRTPGWYDGFMFTVKLQSHNATSSKQASQHGFIYVHRKTAHKVETKMGESLS